MRRKPLPPLDEVHASDVEPPEWEPPPKTPGGGGGSPGPWRPRTPAEQEADRELGRRGEELVYQQEVGRVAALGYPAERVIWSSQVNAASNHDILSVAEDGDDLWLEVKATTGRHGRFDWPRAEFELAVAARDKYILCRVYEADSRAPSILRQSDPIGQLLAGKMRLDIGGLNAEVAPLRGPESLSR
jgi:hypothetical protein